MKTPLAFLAAAAFLAGPLSAEDAKPAAPKSAPVGVMKNVSPDEAQKLLKDEPKAVVLDVRTPAEFAAGHIPGAKNIDFNSPDFAAKVAALDKTTPYLVHCAAGGRSGKTIDLIKDQGFVSVYHLKAGFKGWEKAGKPVEK